MPVEVRRPAHGLARVVDDEVEPVARLVQVPAELLDARRVPQVEAEDLEPVAPDVEVGLLRVPGRRVPRKPRRHDQRGPGPQQLDPGLVADLHPTAREQRDPAGELGGLGPLAVVEVAARQAELVVEGMDLDVALLAHVAVLQVDHLSTLGVVHFALHEVVGREHVRRREHRLLAQHADARLGEHALVVLAASPPSPAGGAPSPSWRRWTTSGLKTSPAAASSRCRSSSGRSPSRPRSRTTASSTSIASRRRAAFPFSSGFATAPRVAGRAR